MGKGGKISVWFTPLRATNRGIFHLYRGVQVLEIEEPYLYILKSRSRTYHFKRNIDENWIVVLKQVFRNCIPLQWTKFWHWVKIFNFIIALHFLDELPGWRCYKQLAADISSPCMSRSLLFTFVAQSLSTCHWDSQFHHQWEYPAHRSTCVQWKENIWEIFLE